MARPKYDAGTLSTIRQMMVAGRSDAEIMKEVGKSRSTVARYKTAIKELWREATADGESIYQESYRRLQEYESLALAEGNLREARECRKEIIKLMGVAAPDRLEVNQHTTGEQKIILEFVNVPEPGPEIRYNPFPPDV